VTHVGAHPHSSHVYLNAVGLTLTG